MAKKLDQKPDAPDALQGAAQLEKSDASKREEEVLAFWQERGIFEKSLEKEAPNGEFVFYDGPPFATGLPHPGHFLASTSKDLIPRYKTMRGYRVRRRWGWDTHGLPIESLVEKKLGLKNKKEIVSLGIEKFNEEARSLVLQYVHDWKKYIERLGRWVDFDNSYKTMDPSYTESVWWALKQIHDKGHLYEGRKVLMYCPHCETPLAKAEIAMDNTYKDVSEETATVKFKLKEPAKNGLPVNTYLLAWTTTPWTLPGNVALAVGSDIQYGIYEKDGQNLIAAVARGEALGLGKPINELSGVVLLGAEYEPLYEIAKVAASPNRKWLVLPADFVTTTDGTGIVHTAVIYGEDDFNLGQKENLPMIPILNPNGTYNDDAPEFIRGQYIKKAETRIKDDLEKRGLLFAREMHTHSYPHCYRCGTALIYNAVPSWFIHIQAVKERMLAENEKISWVPEHLKHGRFAHIIESAPDWTISRNRFWASPLPIWKDTQGNVTVIGSLDELKTRVRKSGNKYFAMRHGTTQHNKDRVLSSVRDAGIDLIDEGKEEVRKGVEALKDAKITKIYSSPFLRTRESAEIAAEVLGLPKESIVIDARLSEFDFGDLNGKSPDELFDWRSAHAYNDPLPGGESDQDAKNRFGDFIYELDRSLSNENILIVTHGIGIECFKTIIAGADKEKSRRLILRGLQGTGEVVPRGAVREIDFIPIPHNRDYELDYHLPYIDEIQLVNDAGEPLTRIPEVVDCWVESGSMPFAEYHYPFENREEFEKRTPGDFISEYIGQTRAWFYYMHAISIHLFGHPAFKNVITTGTIVAGDGEKMSKSKNNYTDPYVLFDRFSADAFRYYLMSGAVMLAEDLAFKDEEVKEVQNRVVNLLRNVLAFYQLFKDELNGNSADESTNILDAWILSRLDEVVQVATTEFDRYDVPHAIRPMREFIDDLSTWYVRRSRDRVKGTNGEDKQRALHTLRAVLRTFSQVIAPVMPFVAEEVFQTTKYASDPESVHLTVWPEAGAADEILNADMVRTRELASQALMLRQQAGIKVRQPLGTLTIPGALASEFTKLIAEEANVKEVKNGPEGSEMQLDTALTPELIREGDVREFLRAFADARKAAGLAPRDEVALTVSKSAEAILAGVQLPATSATSFAEISSAPYQVELSIGQVSFTFSNAA